MWGGFFPWRLLLPIRTPLRIPLLPFPFLPWYCRQTRWGKRDLSIEVFRDPEVPFSECCLHPESCCLYVPSARACLVVLVPNLGASVVLGSPLVFVRV